MRQRISLVTAFLVLMMVCGFALLLAATAWADPAPGAVAPSGSASVAAPWVYELVVKYGPGALAWVLALLGGLIMRLVNTVTKNATAKAMIGRAGLEVQAAVLDVGQSYVSGIKAGRADGTLTAAEAASAKSQALATARSHLDMKALAKVLGLEDAEAWLASKVEATVGAAKTGAPPPLTDAAAAASSGGAPAPRPPI